MPEAANYSFNIGDLVISFRRFKDQRDRIISELNYGWIIEVKLSAENIDDAISQASEISEFFLSAFCFESGCESYPSNIILSYEITEAVEKRIFRQYFRNLSFRSSPTQIAFSSFFEHSEKILSFKTDHKNRIYRALRWFRKGIMSDDPIDQFLFFWHGLETLNSPLAEHFECDKNITKEIERQCKKCGQKYMDHISTLGGIEALYDNIKIDRAKRTKIKDMRNGISHGFKNLSELYGDAIELLPTMAKILHIGITKILGISFEQSHYDGLERVAPIKLGELMKIDFFLNENDISKLALDDYYPFFIYEDSTISKEGGFNVQSKCIPHVGCSYEPLVMGVFTKNSSIKIKDIM